jgi:acyl-coenzyme A synthetase/AMP-(fatty) acid ligase
MRPASASTLSALGFVTALTTRMAVFRASGVSDAHRDDSHVVPVARLVDETGHLEEKLAAYKYPRIVQFMDALPKGPTGKILKRELR